MGSEARQPLSRSLPLHLVVGVLGALGGLLLLAACGQSGPLYLPQTDGAQPPAPAATAGTARPGTAAAATE